MARGVVLVVEADSEVRERIGSWLDEAGFEVLSCPGPTAPYYTCIGGRGGPCPLVEPADVIVLDVWLDSHTMMEGTSAAELLALYVSGGKPVVALVRAGDSPSPFLDEGVVPLRWPPEREKLVDLVRKLLPRPSHLRA